MVSPVSNPGTGASGFVGDVINAGGQVIQGANQAHGDVKNQQAIIDGTGESASVKAQRAESEKSDKNQAAIIGMTGAATREKQTTDGLALINSQREDSANKQISATATNAKGINF
jgi:hypothetical protein